MHYLGHDLTHSGWRLTFKTAPIAKCTWNILKRQSKQSRKDSQANGKKKHHGELVDFWVRRVLVNSCCTHIRLVFVASPCHGWWNWLSIAFGVPPESPKHDRKNHVSQSMIPYDTCMIPVLLIRAPSVLFVPRQRWSVFASTPPPTCEVIGNLL